MHRPPKELHIVVFFPLTVTKEIEPVEEECHFTTLTFDPHRDVLQRENTTKRPIA